MGLPTGKDRKGIGSDNIFEIEPFADFGYKLRDLEVVGFLSLGFPVNQKGDQNDGMSWATIYLCSITWEIVLRQFLNLTERRC